MDRTHLKAGLFFVITEKGEIPGLASWVDALKRWGFSNPRKKGFLPGPKLVFEKRTNQQNKTVMGLWMDQVLDEMGYEATDKEYIFNTLKMEMRFTENRVNKKTGEIVPVPKSTKNLPTDEYTLFMEKFARHMSITHSIVLPDPVAELARI